jgi:hypothetical protein
VRQFWEEGDSPSFEATGDSERARVVGGASERGSTIVLFAVVLPLFLILAAVVWDVGNWWVHQKHLQTKVDAAAFAGGGVWGFPCGPDIDLNIETQARRYVGEHMQADGAPFAATTFNPQVGGTPGSKIHVVLNGDTWWDDDEGSTPLDRTSPLNTSLCDSKTLDVKATEENNIPLFGWIPFFPDIKRKARVQIEEIDGLTGLLPIAVRLPQPLSAAAVFYDESPTTNPVGRILDVKYFREVCTPTSPGCIFGMPPGLGQWTTEPAVDDTSGSWASFNVAGATGVVVATSVRPRCGAGTPPAEPPCLDASGWTGQPVDTFCRQASGSVQCYDADGGGTTQTVRSGAHFIRGHPDAAVTTGRPEVERAWLESVDCPSTGYFNSDPGSCSVKLSVAVDIGSVEENPPPDPPDENVQTRTADHVEVRYCLVRAGETGDTVCETQFGVDQDLNCSGGPGEVTCSTVVGTHPLITPSSRQNAFAIQVRLRRTSVDGFPGCTNDPTSEYNNVCRFFFTGAGYAGDSVPPTGLQVLTAPIQRSFMGDIDRTGPLKWLRLTVDRDCNTTTFTDRIVGTDPITGDDAASQPADALRCYVMEMGLAGGLARDQDEPPIALNLGGVIEGSSQRALVDCDPNIQPDPKEEIVKGCQWPSYAANKFDTTPFCPGTAGFFTLPKLEPFEDWPPFRCVLTQPTAAGNQIIQGFNERLFGKANNPQCPDEILEGYPPPTGSSAPWTKGRNYWHRENNVIDDYTFAWDGDTPGTTLAEKADDWGNELRSDDPRLVTLFFTTYDSFTEEGVATYPIVGFGNFYITGYGRTGPEGWQGGAPDDPCDDGINSLEYEFTGNEPPPDLNYSKNTTWAWGHFVKAVVPNPFTTGGSGVLCNPEASFQPCVAVLVE